MKERLRQWGLSLVLVALTVGLCDWYTVRLAVHHREVDAALASVQAQKQRLSPRPQALQALADRLARDRSRLQVLSQDSPGDCADWLAAVQQRTPIGIVVTHIDMDARQRTGHLLGTCMTDRPLDLVAKFQAAMGRPPFANVQLGSTSTSGTTTTFQMTFSIQKRP